ncbi:hypothetical protein Van01_16730 [Micromonospora andamanensis]|uniref:Uncharacterized protein n=2 Tax=Micromonospora andamanensis TaxID=1287068 RepID=A0ABQ4HS26_9ACTN|nr:hypothetical protein Van01_16730 [Micromonospora andamanensis]
MSAFVRTVAIYRIRPLSMVPAALAVLVIIAVAVSPDPYLHVTVARRHHPNPRTSPHTDAVRAAPGVAALYLGTNGGDDAAHP